MNKYTDPHKIYVNGPINVVRLVGQINGVQKIIYLFMDYHANLESQTECENVFSKDISNYFANNFYDLNKSNETTYDFFFEIFPSEIYNYNSNILISRDIYIREVQKLFKKIFVYDSKTNLVKTSNMFARVRLHYVDIREYYSHYEAITSNRISILFENIVYRLNYLPHEIDNLVQLVKEKIKPYNALIEGYYFNKSNKTPIRTKMIYTKNDFENNNESAQQLLQNRLIYVLNKLIYNYNNNNVGDVINKLLLQTINKATELNKNAIDILKNIDEARDLFVHTNRELIFNESLQKYIKGYSLRQRADIIYTMFEKILIISDQILSVYTKIMDLYFLRRFLDKSYITNGIVYVGANHAVYYIYTLVQHFGFEITHASYSTITDIRKLNDFIKNTKYNRNNNYNIFIDPTMQQCSDLSDFPKKFK